MLAYSHGRQNFYDRLDIFIIIEQKKVCWVEDFFGDTDYSSLQFYRMVYEADHSLYQ